MRLLFQDYQACGMVCIKGLVDFAKHNECSLIRLLTYNSGDISGDTNKVVGYGSWFLYTDASNKFLEKYYSKYLLKLVKATLIATFNGEEFIPQDIPAVLTQQGATFVTIKKNGQLRGCMGSVYPTKPLLLDLIDNTKNAAFQDPRFEPLVYDELNDIQISVSLLSSTILFNDIF